MLEKYPELKRQISNQSRRLANRLRQMSQGQMVFIFYGLLLFTICVAVVYWAETKQNEMFKTFWDSLWWAFVSATTVGYGDKYPMTGTGRLVAGVTILSGMVMMSIVTASISSVMVERRLRDKMGLGQINEKGHIVICGWDKKGNRLIERLSATYQYPDIVLINEMTEEEVNDIIYQHSRGASVKFIKGDFTMEATVKRANILHASMVFILSDSRFPSTNHDERAALSTLTMKSIQPNLKICAELINAENRQHLVRAGADGIVVRGEYDETLLSLSLINPGISDLFKTLMTSQEMPVKVVDIPRNIIGQAFSDATKVLREKNGYITIGLLAEDPEMSLESMLTDDFSQIDAFIKKMFEEAGITSGTARNKRHLILNPADDTVIEDGYKAIVVS